MRKLIFVVVVIAIINLIHKKVQEEKFNIVEAEMRLSQIAKQKAWLSVREQFKFEQLDQLKITIEEMQRNSDFYQATGVFNIPHKQLCKRVKFHWISDNSNNRVTVEHIEDCS